MAKRKIIWNSERILSLSAMSISFITLIIFIYQTNLMSKQNYLSILPYLQTSTSYDGEHMQFSLSVLNHGVGPAIIESVTSEIEGEEHDIQDFDGHFWDFLVFRDSILGSLKDVSTSTLHPGDAIPANTKYTIFIVRFVEEDRPKLLRLINMLETLPYEIKYKSIQNERWMISEEGNEPIKLD